MTTERFVLRSAVLVCVVTLMPVPASAQGRPFGKVQLAIGQGYDDNLFASPATGNPRSDFITRVGPIFEGGYQSPALSLLAMYGFDAEKYIDQVQLDDNLARQEARLDFRYRPAPRVSLLVSGSYLDTQTPRELNIGTLLPAGRARAQRLRGLSGLEYEPNAVMKVSVDYERAEDDIEGGLSTIAHTARVGVSQRATSRNTFRTESRFAHIAFQDETRILTMAVTGGWSRVLTPFFTLDIDAGPRISSGRLRPELGAQLKRRLRRGELLVGYFATEETTFGEVGTIQVQRVMGSWLFNATRAVAMRITPAAVRSLRESPATVYEVDGEVTIRANAKLAFVASGHLGQQNGTFSGTPDIIPYRGVNFKTIVTLQ